MTIFIEIVKEILISELNEIKIELAKSDPTFVPSPPGLIEEGSGGSLKKKNIIDLVIEQIEGFTLADNDDVSRIKLNSLLDSTLKALPSKVNHSDRLKKLLTALYAKLNDCELTNVKYDTSDGLSLFQYFMACYFAKHTREDQKQLHEGGVINLIRAVVQDKQLTTAKEMMVLNALRQCREILEVLTYGEKALNYRNVYQLVVKQQLQLLQIENHNLAASYSSGVYATVSSVTGSVRKVTGTVASFFAGSPAEASADKTAETVSTSTINGHLEECIINAMYNLDSDNARLKVVADAVGTKHLKLSTTDLAPPAAERCSAATATTAPDMEKAVALQFAAAEASSTTKLSTESVQAVPISAVVVTPPDAASGSAKPGLKKGQKVQQPCSAEGATAKLS